MKKWLFWLLLIFTLPGYSQSPNEEFRATWVLDSHWLNPSNNVDQNKALIREVLDNHKAANMTSVIWQVRRFGTVYYPSAIENWGPRTNFVYPGFDPLAYAIEEAHARGLEFHAWMNTFESRHQYAGSPSAQHSEWICRDGDDIIMPPELSWLSPGLPEVRNYLVNVAMEIVNNYDIDGLHMDFVRWNEHSNSLESLEMARQNIKDDLPDGMISEAQYQYLAENTAGRFLYDPVNPKSGGVPAGFGSWAEWWRWSVTEYVSTLHDSIQAVKPWVRLSPAAIGRYNWGGWQGYHIVYQDAALWLNQGYIEQIMGMNYHWSTASAIHQILESGCPDCWGAYIQPGVQAGRMYSVGFFSDNFSHFNVHKPMIDTIRTIPWASGFQFFSYSTWDNLNAWETGKEQFFQTKAKIHAMELYDDIPPDAPAINVMKIDSLNYDLALTPAASTMEKGWFAIYRSEDAILSTTDDPIIDIVFGDVPYIYSDSFDGLQDFDGIYHYFATAFDRYWNESAVSNAGQSDPIPSFAPVVSFSDPAQGDTIPANRNPKITFSKTMNTGSFSNAIAFSPPVSINNLYWSADQKTVTVDISGNFIFSTTYSLTIAETVTDINGKQLDGDGNGSGGDPFQIAFHTLSEDLQGPLLNFSFPNVASPEIFVIDDVITLAFDEEIDVNSIADSTIQLTSDGAFLDIDYDVTQLGEMSVLSIQPSSPLISSTDHTLDVFNDITDTLGNEMPTNINVSFQTSPVYYTEMNDIDDFTAPGNWWQPNASGTTTGIITSNTAFDFTTSTALPASSPKQAASLNYEWDTSASAWLLREYLAGGAPYNVIFDNSYVLQCYIYSDGSRNKIRFAIDDNVPGGGAVGHEVSKWITLDWVGWRLAEWDLSDPGSVGTWIGNGILEGNLRFDSFQMTFEPGVSAPSGKIFFDNLRLVKKTSDPSNISDASPGMPTDYQLYQNYPNPFNPSTILSYALPKPDHVNLVVYDMLGREVITLVNERQAAGRHQISFDGSRLTSGIYIYRLRSGKADIARRMLLVK